MTYNPPQFNIVSNMLVALSPDGSKFATCIPTPGTSIRVQILATTDATLQSTLLHRRTGSTTTQPSLADDDKDALPRKIVFIHDAAVAVLCTDLIVVWDLNRGVVACSIPTKSAEHVFVDITVGNSADNNKSNGLSLLLLYALVYSKESGKAQIHAIVPETGKVNQKVKAGKGGPFLALQLASSSDDDGDGEHAVVRQEDAIRIVNMATGQKVAKYTALQTASAALVAADEFCVTLENGEALVISTSTGKRMASLPLDHADDTLDLWKTTDKTQDGYFLRIGSKIYAVTRNGKEATLRTHIAATRTADQRHLFGKGRAVYALLYKANQFQANQSSLVADVDDDPSVSEILLDWTDASDAGSRDDKKKTLSVKRKDAGGAVVLGPAQSGGQASGIADGPVSKKSRKAAQEDNDEMDVEKQEGLDEPDDDDQGPSIAERLQKLQQAFDAEQEEEEEEDAMHMAAAQEKAPHDFKAKKATTESLTQLLEQALQSSDDAMLELALQVRDTKVLQETCNNLPQEHLLNFLNALTSRLASKPARAVNLQPWISAVLKTGHVRSMAHLQPLRNIIEERVAVFPALLKLEGRLSMITHQ